MCLIIHKPVNVTIPEWILNSGLRKNPDGWGLLYRSAGQVVAVHGLYPSKRKSRKALRRTLLEVGPRECLLHLRMATHGDVSRENTHPFRVRAGADDLWMMHNGILHGYGVSGLKNGQSDTRDFLARIIEPLTSAYGAGILENPAVRTLIEDHAGDNRLAFMDAERGPIILNRAQGVEHAGLWLSNTYAWDAPLSLLPAYHGWRGHWPVDDDEDDFTTTRGDVIFTPSADRWNSVEAPELDDYERYLARTMNKHGLN